MNTPSPAPTQDELKALVGQAALAYVPEGEILGVGSGSTVNKFIDALGASKLAIKGAVSTKTLTPPPVSRASHCARCLSLPLMTS